MRILIAGTVHYPAMNGQAVFTENLTEGLAKRGNEVLSIFPSEIGPAYSATRNNVQVEALRSSNLNMIHSDAFFSLFSESAIRKILRAFQPNIVHVQDHFPLSQDVVQVAKNSGIPLIGTNHFMPENLAAYVPFISNIKPLYNHVMWAWMLAVYNRLEIVTAQSKASAALMQAKGLKIPVYPVSCGIDLNRFHPDSTVKRAAVLTRFGLDPNRTIFLFVGRVDHEKRLDVILRALKKLDRDDIQLGIAGHGAAQESLRMLANELELGERVHFTGFVPADDLPDLLNSVDIFTMPSEAELLSIASLEAMACGRPVLLANAVALPELAGNGINGYLFQPGNPIDAARCIALLADHPEHWARMGANSLEKAKHHSMENTIKQYETLYVNLLAGTYSSIADPGLNSYHSLPTELIGNKK
ncbi:MAG: glycosyltransferase [Chloroflexi bacterium]|nr:glycosyltransferase [Chloroflexota bacterium]